MLKQFFSSPSDRLTIPLLILAFGCGLFMTASNDIWFAPCFVALLTMGWLLTARAAVWTLPRSATVGFILLYWLYLFIALPWSSVPFISTLFTLVFSVLPFLFFMLILSRTPYEASRNHAFVVFALLAILALWAVVQFFFMFEAYGPRIAHPLLDPNNLAALLNMGFVPALALFFFVPVRRSPVFVAALALVLLFYTALMATESRGGLLSLVTATAVLAAITLRWRREDGVRLLILLAIMVLIPILMHTGSVELHGRNMGKTMLTSYIVSVTDRQSLWWSTVQMIRDHWLTGFGLGTFYYYYGAYRLPKDQSDGFFAHMDPLQMGAELGVAAPLLLYAVLIAVLLRTIRALRATARGDRLRLEIAGSFCGLLVLCLHTHISYHLYILAMQIPIACLLAYWYTATERALGDERRTLAFSTPRRRHLALACFALLLILVGQWSARAAVSTHFLNQAARWESQPDRVREYVRLAGLLAPASQFNVPQYEARWRMVLLQKDGATMPLEEKRRLVEEGLAYLDKAQSANKNLTILNNDRAKLYFYAHGDIIPDGYARAIEELKKVVAADPLFLDARMGLARIYRRQGDMKKALEVMEEGLRWPRVRGRRDVDFLMSTALLRRQMGDEAGYVQLMREAEERAEHYGLKRVDRP